MPSTTSQENSRPHAAPGWIVALLIALTSSGVLSAAWIDFADETLTRFLGSSDTDEKDYAWGDVDNDGDIDLVVVRKQEFTSPGKRVNFLFINENGVLVDRTTEFASASDVGGDNGFDTPTNDRDVRLVDVDQDGWLDVVTATTISDGDPKHLGHPRIYMNLGCTGACGGTSDWLGFRYEEARIPTMNSWNGEADFNPRFCSVNFGDIDGDGYPDLWFGDYDSSGAGGSGQPSGADFNDRLLLNQGAANPGFYTDVTQGAGSRFSGTIQIGQLNTHFAVSAFGAAGAIADMNGDGVSDIVKQTSLNSPTYVGVAYNDPNDEGFFDTYEVIYTSAPYFISVGDLNNDNKMDLVVTDDGADRYLLNQGLGGNGLADFLSYPFQFRHSGAGGPTGDDGFGSNSVIADLDNDGWNDVVIADVDVDIGGGAARRMHIYRNLGGQPGDQIVLEEESEGSNCEEVFSNPASCLVASIPSDALESVHDVAIFDLDGDGWNDMVLGRKSGTSVYINQPPAGVSFSYPQGLPTLIPPGQTVTVQLQLLTFGGATITPGTAQLFTSVSGSGFVGSQTIDLGGNLHEATLPAAGCAEDYRFYFRVAIDQGGSFFDPPAAPVATHTAVAAVGTTTVFLDDVESDVSSWTIVDDPLLTGGTWEQAVPNGTISGAGDPAAPGQDAESAPGQLQAFVTENGLPGGDAFAADVDGGPTTLISPTFDLSGSDGFVSYYRWFHSSNDDSLLVEVTADGFSWQTVETVSGFEDNSWQQVTFRVGQYVTPSATVQIRFVTEDFPDNSLTEAAIDLITVERLVCTDCVIDEDCEDSLFCDGAETCNAGACSPGADPCPGQQCDDSADICIDCTVDAHCDDGTFCNGSEVCISDTCQPGSDPCPGEQCDEIVDACVDCLVAADCDDAQFCNGVESCVGGTCFAGVEPCPGRFCDESDDLCEGTVPLQPRMGDPLLELNAFQKSRFLNGKADFDKVFTQQEGLGPVFNQDSCGSCHNQPLGGFGTTEVTRFGHVDAVTGAFDPLESLGGSLLQHQSLTTECAESIPPEANISAERVTTPTLGAGLVEAIPDASIQALADFPPAGVSGRTHVVEIPEAPPGTTGVGRFGWKAQGATVMSFSAGAALNEMGITSRVFPTDVAPNNDAAKLLLCDSVADPEDFPNEVGMHFIDRVNEFQQFLAPPPQTPKVGMTGEQVFNNIGCNSCHISTFTTADDVSILAVLRDRTLKPYSDFLLHDVGGNSDQIADGGADAREMRTAPLWGVRARDPLWHDGRVAGGTFADRVASAIGTHDDPFSEGQASAQAFAALTTTDQELLIAFLDSLGRAEFDFDGDNDVDLLDWQQFDLCYTGAGSFFTPDDPCAIADVDGDGDIDEADFVLFLVASEGAAAGAVPVSLEIGLETDGDVTLTWADSCTITDVDYAVYVGEIGDFTSHSASQCSTGSATLTTFAAPDDVYFLVVPHNGDREGSYGVDGSGTPRLRAVSGACLPQETSACAAR